MKKRIVRFEDLECWKAYREVRIYVMKIIKKFPPEEKYALVDGMRRSSRSTTENIAEGFGRYHYGENIQFCRISRGSLHELIDQFISAFDDNYINEDEYKNGRQLIETALAILNGFINYLQKAKSGKYNEPKNSINEDLIEYENQST
ncbi:MAG: four helix bundle protein [Bacteroidales bacterium]|nr:four helix bundle protein [Bacteroidales bacterium]MCF8402940.1 four helix bundle protein [Bacteroidales bacterium]